MNLAFYTQTFRLGLANLRLHKLRSFLTTLGIIFGVLSVITMVAIGEGGKQQTLKAVAQLGATNVILRTVAPPENTRLQNRQSRTSSYGLKRLDLEAVQEASRNGNITFMERIVPVRDSEQMVVKGEIRANCNPVATTPEFFEVAHLQLAQGRLLTPADMEQQRAVCVLSAAVAQQLFGAQSPLEDVIRIGGRLFEVVGVLQPVGLAGGKGSSLTGRDLNRDLYFPLTTSALFFSDTIVRRTGSTFERKQIELSEVYIRVDVAEHVEAVAAALGRMLELRHTDTQDFSVIVPRELLNQADATQRTFNLIMGGIASLSLLVGGIGIMNISLASVTERTREIGVRRALGARRQHIILQFLIETTTLSVAGGLIGVLGGIVVSLSVEWLSKGSFPTSITLWSVVLSFCISAGVGIIFGLYPAIVAAHKDPIQALRHD